MFARVKKSGVYQYLQLVENRWENGQSRQRVITTLGRLDQMAEKGEVESLVRSLSRFSERTLLILSDKSKVSASAKKIGPALIFERLWKELEDDHTHAPRCTKDVIEEQMFDRRKNLFTDLDFVFLDTTALYFEGEGGKTIGERGHSKDHRPDLNQVVVGALLDDRGRPIACEMWPGNTADVTNQHHPGRHEAKETIRGQQVLHRGRPGNDQPSHHVGP
jgi:hypothetical protein